MKTINKPSAGDAWRAAGALRRSLILEVNNALLILNKSMGQKNKRSLFYTSAQISKIKTAITAKAYSDL